MTTTADLRKRVSYLSGVKETRAKTLADLKQTLKQLDEDTLRLEKAKKVLGHLMQVMSGKSMGEMDKLVSHGLESVFKDRDLSFKSSLVDTGKKLSISLDTFEGANRVPDDDMGSVSVVESFLLRMLCILKLKKPRLMLLDETFAAVDSNYINSVGPLISELCSQLGFDVLLVTHNPGASDTSTLRASLVHGELTLKMETT